MAADMVTIDINGVNNSLNKINNIIDKKILNSIISLIRYTKAISDGNTWDSQAKNILCSNMMGMLLDNNQSVSGSLDTLKKYVDIIIENYNALEGGLVEIFQTEF